jgi:glyoxylate carboligase
VARPTFRRATNVTVPIEKTVPAIGWGTLCDAHELSAEVIGDNAVTAFLIDDLMQTMAVLFKGAMGKRHSGREQNTGDRRQELVKHRERRQTAALPRRKRKSQD